MHKYLVFAYNIAINKLYIYKAASGPNLKNSDTVEIHLKKMPFNY